MSYINGLTYTASPDYAYMKAMITCAGKTAEVDLNDLFDWEEGAKPNMKRYKKKKNWFFGGDDKKKKEKKKKVDSKSHKDDGKSHKDTSDNNQTDKKEDKEKESDDD